MTYLNPITLSVNPTYYCNFRCDFCYLTEEQLSDPLLLSIEQLSQKVDEVMKYREIKMVDLYGGEVGLLSEEYYTQLKNVFYERGINDLNLITNLSMVNSITLDPDVWLTVSYDFDCREQSDRVWNNMLKLETEFSVLILCSQKMLDKDVPSMIEQLNLLTNCVSVEIKPYSQNQSNCHNVTFEQFENFVKQWIEYPNKQFQFMNEDQINQSLNKERNSFSDDHIYINPNGNYSVLEFDLNDREFFLEMGTFPQYLEWCEFEKKRVTRNKFCSQCKYFGNCLSEHLREVKSVDQSCNGFFKLLEWYDSRIT